MKSIQLTLMLLLTLSLTPAQANIWDAFSDLTSFGQVGRERDKARAQGQRLVALERELAAEKLKQAKLESLLQQRAIIGANLASDKEILSTLGLLSTLLESQKNYLRDVVIILFQFEVEYEGMAQIVLLQQKELHRFLSAILERDPENEKIENTILLVGQFIEQIESFPVDEWDFDSFDKTLQGAFAGSNESVNLLNLAITALTENIKKQEDQLAQNEADEEEIKKPEPKPSGGAMGSCPTMIPQPGGGFICGAAY